MLAAIEVGTWQNREMLEKLTPEIYAAIRVRWPKMNLPEEQDKLKGWYNSEDMFVDDAEMAALVDDGFKFEVKKIRGVANLESPLHQTIYQVSVANVGLMQVTAVDVLKDVCTDELQGYLDKGWRILAVCPPNDARRPTYIIGHHNREMRSN
jgi:hypothetical protein